MTQPNRRARIAQWGLLAVPIVLGLVLIASSIQNYLGAKGIVDDLTRGQAEGFARDVRDAAQPGHGPPRGEDLAVALRSGSAAGLRHVAVFDPWGEAIAVSGESVANAEDRLPIPGELQRLRGRVRWLVPPPPAHPAPPGVSGPRPWPPPFPPPDHAPPPYLDDKDHPGPPGHAILVELEPVAAVALMDRSERNVVLNMIAALILMAAATILWRLQARAQRFEADLAQQQHLAVLGEMSAVLAHEIRNPLATVKGHAQLIAERVGDDPVQSKWAKLMIEHVLRLERLTNQLLDFSRTREVSRRDISPAELLDEAGFELDRDRIRLDTTKAPATFSLDPDRMNQVFVNVMQNALQASPGGESIEVAVEERAGSLFVSIRDCGEGIPPGSERLIFEPFHTKRIRGTGLGLTVAKRIVELHGGRIEASNHPEGGAEFRITLPKE